MNLSAKRYEYAGSDPAADGVQTPYREVIHLASKRAAPCGAIGEPHPRPRTQTHAHEGNQQERHGANSAGRPRREPRNAGLAVRPACPPQQYREHRKEQEGMAEAQRKSPVSEFRDSRSSGHLIGRYMQRAGGVAEQPEHRERGDRNVPRPPCGPDGFPRDPAPMSVRHQNQCIVACSRLQRLGAHAASLRSPSQSVRNPTTWFQLGVIRDAGPEITNGLGAFLYAARPRPGFGRAFSLAQVLLRWGRRRRKWVRDLDVFGNRPFSD